MRGGVMHEGHAGFWGRNFSFLGLEIFLGFGHFLSGNGVSGGKGRIREGETGLGWSG